ncbi:ATP-binding protein [Streptomyces sp. NPDC006335]|uniref:ATP-binding protein n=1 Tax=Streptomyces sp. NPDC006335 TaxID=3156895 RepID=UPI0033BF519D
MTSLVDTPTGTSARSTSRSSSYESEIDLTAESLKTVRRIVRAHLRLWGVDADQAECVLLCVNELLTNVLLHTTPDPCGHRTAILLVQRVAGGITTVVTDKDPRSPVRTTPGPLDESGRGLNLVRALVDEIQISPTQSGKDVWFFVADPDTCALPALSH